MSSLEVDPIRVALLGAWHVHVDDHGREVSEHPGAELAYVWDENPVRGAAVAARWGTAYVGGDEVLEVLRAHPVDAVMVTVAPNRKQATLAAALASGVHVLTEKPLAIREADALDLQRRAWASGRQLWLSMPFLRSPATVFAANAVRDGSLGTVTSVRVRLGIDGGVAGWLPDRFLDVVQAPGGVLADLACHPLYIVDRIVGAEPVRTSCHGTRVRSAGVEDHAVVIHQYASGMIAVIESTFVDSPGGSFTIELVGTAGALRWDGARGVLETVLEGGAWKRRPLEPAPGHPATDFLDAVIDGAPVGATFAEAAQLSRRLESIVGPAIL